MSLSLLEYDTEKRNGTADLLKGLAVIFMIQVHITELFTTQEIFDSFIGSISLFLGGPPAAPIFMAVMGYFLAGSKKDFETSILRGIYLFFGGILLNIGLNFNLLLRIYKGEFFLDPMQYVFGVDILLLAGLSIILLTLLKKLINIHFVIPLLLSFLIAYLTEFTLSFADFNSPLLTYSVPMIGGQYSWSYFPLLPWFSYPLLGWSFWMMKKKLSGTFIADKQITILSLLAWGLYVYLTIEFGILVSATLPVYYHHGIEFFIWVIFFLTGYLFLIAKINSVMSKSVFLIYLKWLGKNVTLVYVFQWLIIGNISTEIYKTQNLTSSVLWFFAIMLVVSILIIAWTKIAPKLQVTK